MISTIAPEGISKVRSLRAIVPSGYTKEKLLTCIEAANVVVGCFTALRESIASGVERISLMRPKLVIPL